MNIAGILHHWFHLYRSLLIDSPDKFSVYYTPYRSTNTADSRTRENSDTPYFKNTANNIIMNIAYWIDRNMEITAVYLSQTPFNSESGFTAFTNPSSASHNKLFKKYTSPPCSNSSSPLCRKPACRHSPNSNLDLDACLKKGYCRLFSHCFNARLEYNSEMETSDISPSGCFTMGGDLTAVTQQFISTQIFTARTVKVSKLLQGSCTL